MPLPEGLLNPIPGDSPSGRDLRYDPVYDKIREARRAEEELQLSEEASKSDVWTRAVKKADYIQVIKLSTEALSKKTKDLQIAAWLTEAMLAQEKITGLTQGLELVRGLMEHFWDTLFPGIEEDDLEMRAAPINWIATRLDIQIRRVALTKNKLDWFKFEESRRVPSEKDANENEAKKVAREAALAEKKCTPEQFDDGVRASGDAFYRQLTSDLGAAVEAAQSLESLSDEKFGQDAPSFSILKKALEDLQDAVKEYWRPEQDTPQEAVVAEEQPEEAAANQQSASSAPSSRREVTAAEPADADDAIRRIVSVSRFLRLATPTSPVPYLLLRSLRWGELRANGTSLDSTLLASPPSETRQMLKKLAADGNWNELLEASETAMSQPFGRGWLDLQRYTLRSCENLGYDFAAAAVRSELLSLLADFPNLVSACLSDDTPAANTETQSWITENILPPPPAPEPQIHVAAPAAPSAATTGSNGSSAPDVFELAQQAARAGRIQDAVELLSREIGQERSGRARFQRKVQLAALCLSVKHEAVAYPILAELADEIDKRKLEEWEEAAALAHPLALLFRCMDKLGYDDSAKQKIYQKICRLDPVQALSGLR